MVLTAEKGEIPPNDLTIIIGDFNIKVVHDNSGFREQWGNFVCGIIDENGEHLVDFVG